MKTFQIDVANRQDRVACPEELITDAALAALSDAVEAAEVSVAVVGDREISRLNNRFLGREGPTDVIAFAYETEEDYVQGEIVVNADCAVRESERTSHGVEEELLLYVVHGALHLLGYDDAEPEQRRLMHEKALEVLRALGHELDTGTLLEE